MENTVPAENRISFRLAALALGEEMVIGLVTLVLVFSFLCRICTVAGASMAPFYTEGDRVLVVSFAGAPRRGDVIVAQLPGKEPIIKRVIATEGQTVDFDYVRGAVLVDGQAVDEEAFGLSNGVTTPPYATYHLLSFPQTVPEGCVFVLGDNRSVSEDSRYAQVGMIDRRNITGKVVCHLYPFGKQVP